MLPIWLLTAIIYDDNDDDDGDDVLLELLGTLVRCYVSRPVAKTFDF